MHLKDKTAIVTGAAHGIGREIARQFVQRRRRGGDRRLEPRCGRRAADEIDAGGSSTFAIEMDVTERGEVKPASTRCAAIRRPRCPRVERGHPDRLSGRSVRFADWKKMLAIHLDGAFLTTHARPSQDVRAGTAARSSTSGRRTPRKRRSSRRRTSRRSTGCSGWRESSPRKAPSTASARMSSVPDSCARRSSKSRFRTAKELGISEAEVVKRCHAEETVDGEFTTLDDVAAAPSSRGLPSNALTGQSIVVSHGWSMQ